MFIVHVYSLAGLKPIGDGKLFVVQLQRCVQPVLECDMNFVSSIAFTAAAKNVWENAGICAMCLVL